MCCRFELEPSGEIHCGLGGGGITAGGCASEVGLTVGVTSAAGTSSLQDSEMQVSPAFNCTTFRPKRPMVAEGQAEDQPLPNTKNG